MTSNFFYVEYPRADRNEPQASVVEARAHLPRVRVPGSTALRSAQREIFLGTAQEGILLGITRQIVIEIAQNNRLEVKYQPLKRDQLSAAQEAFITSSSRGVVPVIQIDEVMVGQGRPGPITKKLSAIYDVYVTKKAEKI
jgi:branched-chain amino acid aminotransferase